MTVTFCGHGDTPSSDDIKTWLVENIEALINRGAETFYLGGYGSFDGMAATAVWSLKTKYPHIKSILVLPYLDRKVETKKYDYTTYPLLETVPRRYAITHRNRWMVDNSDVIIAYVRHRWGGAAQTLERAKRRKHEIINWPSLTH